MHKLLASTLALLADERGFLGISLGDVVGVAEDVFGGGSDEPRADINTGFHNVRYCSSGSYPLELIRRAWNNAPRSEREALFRAVGRDQPGNTQWKKWNANTHQVAAHNEPEDTGKLALLAHMTNGGFDCRITDDGEARSQQRMGAFVAKYAGAPGQDAPVTDDPSSTPGGVPSTGGGGGILDDLAEAVAGILEGPETDEPAGVDTGRVQIAGFQASPLVFLALGGAVFYLLAGR